MRTPNNLAEDEIITQIVPLPEVPRHEDMQCKTLVIDEDGRRYYPVGLALTNRGNVYPIGFDYFSNFTFIYDPTKNRV